MGKNTIRMVAVAVMLLCFNASASAQLSELLGKVTEVLSTKLVPTSKQIQGTWTYQRPAVVLKSDNTIASLGGAAASTKIEDKLQTYFSKVGMTKGKMSITFKSDKTFCVNFKNKKITGTYTISDNDVHLTFKGRTKPCSLTPQLENGSLVVVGDATKLKDFLQNVAGTAGTKELAAVSSLMKNFNGMLIGIRFSK